MSTTIQFKKNWRHILRQYCLIFLFAALIASCAGQRNRVLIRPDPAQYQQQEGVDPFDSWQVIESKLGHEETEIPQWVRLYYNNRFRGIESLDEYSGRYVFAGENRGTSFNALEQWANGFNAEHDLPRLVAARVEQRLVSLASLYTDDEYGQYFENLIKRVSDEEFPGAVKGEVFWLKRIVIVLDEESAVDDEPPQEIISERYEFLALISIAQETLQHQLREIMASIRATLAPTREQSMRISRAQDIFFEGF